VVILRSVLFHKKFLEACRGNGIGKDVLRKEMRRNAVNKTSDSLFV